MSLLSNGINSIVEPRYTFLNLFFIEPALLLSAGYSIFLFYLANSLYTMCSNYISIFQSVLWLAVSQFKNKTRYFDKGSHILLIILSSMFCGLIIPAFTSLISLISLRVSFSFLRRSSNAFSLRLISYSKSLFITLLFLYSLKTLLMLQSLLFRYHIIALHYHIHSLHLFFYFYFWIIYNRLRIFHQFSYTIQSILLFIIVTASKVFLFSALLFCFLIKPISRSSRLT
jgi:hypothetical protein